MSSFQKIGEKPVERLSPSDRKIDYDRGVIIKFIQELGMEVFMYVDEPGVFLSQHGTEVAPALAKKAGFDIDLLLRRRKHAALVKLATDSYAEQLALTGLETATQQVIAEKNGFKVVLFGGTRYAVLDPSGDELTKGIPLTEKVALSLLDDVTAKAPGILDDAGGGMGAGGDASAPAKGPLKK